METHGASRELAWVDMVMRRLARVEEANRRLQEENDRLQGRCDRLESASTLAPGFVPFEIAERGVYFQLVVRDAETLTIDSVTATFGNMYNLLAVEGCEVTLLLEYARPSPSLVATDPTNCYQLTRCTLQA